MTDKNLFPNDQITCIAPWYELRINPDGSMDYCHATKSRGKLSDLSFKEWFEKSASVQQIRTDIQQGHPITDCSQCYTAEQNNLISFRQRRNLQAAIYHGKNFSESVRQSPSWNRISGQTDKFLPSFIHVSLSNLCNLSCRMCYPGSSSQLISLYKKVGMIDDSVPVLTDWTTNHSKWTDFCNLVIDNPSLVSLHFMGGEPLYHKKFYEFLNLCIEKNKTDFHLSFTTNGTQINQELVEKLAQFKSVFMGISIENFHYSNDYIRIGSSFSQVKQNIEKFLQLKSDNISVCLRPAPQALSIEHYDTLIDFAIEHDINIDNNHMDNPRYLKIIILPPELKHNIQKKLKEKYQWLLDEHKYLKSTVDPSRIVNLRNKNSVLEQIRTHIEFLFVYLEESEPKDIEELRTQFVQYNQKIDLYSDLKFVDVYPELVKMYNEKQNKH
jgi:MoaA/NifB/PqqE/SkfB family radical SAM enzyme